VSLFNYVIQVFVGTDKRLSGQDAFGHQFGDGLMRRPTAVERDLLRGLIISDRFFEEAYGGLSFAKTLSGLYFQSLLQACPLPKPHPDDKCLTLVSCN
jgi:hypothetical protein